MIYEIFILILQKINNKFTYEINRVIADLFLSLFNKFNINEVINKFKSDINDKNIDILKNIDFDEINNIKINEIIHNEKIINDKTILIEYEFLYNNTFSIKYSKKIPKIIFNKLKINEIYPRLILQYSMIGFDTGHFWGLHPKIYNYIKRKYKNPLECFASPFNHNLDKYYSLFPSIDKYYGSIGNFFDDFMKADNDMFTINPPFIEDIMIKVFNYILEKSKTCNSDFLVYIPTWDDIILSWLKKQRKIRKVYLCNLRKYQSIVYDYINHKSIKSSFNTYIIYITSKENNNINKLCNLQRK